MRHRKKKGRLNRRTSWRKATLKSMAKDLFTYQRIETTKVKAKALRVFAEPLITLAKNNPDSVAARRKVFQKLCDKTVVKTLFNDLAPLYKGINGGYTRIMACGNRKGDGAEVAIIELVKRTIPDDKLLGTLAKPEKKNKKKKTAKAEDQKPQAKKHVAPDVNQKDKEEHVVEDTKKDKAKKEQKKVKDKGLFKRFRRKSIG